ncbi:hypothetical protein C8R48DRAFT_766871 [Suillus tomentosus]|nr:hypothetical protein C8R48DRAFT_766871 [Suillus tomentosus]
MSRATPPRFWIKRTSARYGSGTNKYHECCQANYDIEASNLVTDRMSSANTVKVPAKFSSGTFH